MSDVADPQQPSQAEQQTQALLNQVRKAAPEQPHGQLLLMLCECIQRLDNLERLVRGAFNAISAPDTPPLHARPQSQQYLPRPPVKTVEATPEQPTFPRIYPPPPRGPEDVQPLTAA